MSESEFNAAAEMVKTFKSKPSDEDLLTLYAFYKQATVGDVNTARPGMLDFKGKAKWDAWDAKKGLAQDQARANYIEKANQLKEIHG